MHHTHSFGPNDSVRNINVPFTIIYTDNKFKDYIPAVTPAPVGIYS